MANPELPEPHSVGDVQPHAEAEPKASMPVSEYINRRDKYMTAHLFAILVKTGMKHEHAAEIAKSSIARGSAEWDQLFAASRITPSLSEITLYLTGKKEKSEVHRQSRPVQRQSI